MLGNIIGALGNLISINKMLKCHSDHKGYATNSAYILRIIDNGGNHKKIINARISCIDKDNILVHFPGYNEKRELWDYWRTHTVDHRIFIMVVKGEYPNYLRDYKNQKSIECTWE